jgi:hypothetical protein
LIGVRLNREIKTGRTLFWVPMQYWGVVLGVYGVLILVGSR